MVYQAAGSLPSASRERSKPACRRALLAAVTLLLVTSLAQGAPNAASRGGGGQFKVVDKHGNLVGYTVTDNLVARDINGVWVTFFIHPAVGIFDSGAIYLHYLNDGCTGTAYVPHYSSFSEGTRVGATLYYPADQQQLNPLSLRVLHGDGTMDACQQASNIQGVYGVAATVDVSSFGLELPFTATQ